MNKKTLISITFLTLFVASTSWGQKYRNLDFFSASGHLGMNMLPRPKNPESKLNGPGFHFNGNFAYKFDYVWGARVDLGFNVFNASQKPNVKALTIGISGFMDVLQYGTEGYVEDRGEFSLIAYSGFGLASAWEKRRLSGDTKYITGNDDMLYYNLGVIPRIRLDKDITLNCDFGYMLYFFKDRYFDGTGVMPKKRPGGNFTLSFGITYEFK